MAEQSISYEGRDLSNPKATMKECGVGNKAMLLLRRKINVAGMRVHLCLLCRTLNNVLHLSNSSGSREIERDAEMMRLQILGDPNLMQELERVRPYNLSAFSWKTIAHSSHVQAQPELANAARSDPARFSQLLRQFRQMQADAELERQREIIRLEADPFDVEAQRKIEEAIRQQAVLENMEHALEYSPEAFGRVTML